MKNLIFFFAAVLIFVLFPLESKAQGTMSFKEFLKEYNALAHKSMRSANLHALGTTHNGLPIGISSANQILKKINKTTANTTQAYLVDTAIVYSAYDSTTMRYSYSYNDSGLVISELAEKWQSGQWTNSSFTTVTWEPSSNQFVESASMWHNGQWANVLLTTYTLAAFKPNANLISIVSLIDTLQNGQWENYQQELNTYNSNGNELSNLSQFWYNGHWMTYSTDTSTYDANGNRLTNLDENWNNGNVIQFNADTCTYDANGHKLTDLNENNYNPSQVSRTLDTYTYDQNGNKISDLDQTWSSGQWVNFMLNTYTYDAGGHQLADSNDIWGSQWIFASRGSKTYNGSGQLTIDSTIEWTGSQSILTQLLVNTYDANGNLVSSSQQGWNGSGLGPLDNNVDISDGPNNGLMSNYYGYNVILSYTIADIFQITSVPASQSNIPQAFSLSQNYPNPFNPTTTISFSIPSQSYVSLKVFDIAGREVATIVSGVIPAGTYARQWDATKMSSGVYFYRLQAGNLTETKKLVLLK
jgi:hypothetical protein